MFVAVPDLKFDVSREELLAHLTKRRDHHLERRSHYEGKAADLRAKVEKAMVDGELRLPDDLLELVGLDEQGFSGYPGMGVVPMVGAVRQNQREAIHAKLKVAVERAAKGVEARAAQHAAAAERFSFWHGHLAPAKSIQLGFADLERLEFYEPVGPTMYQSSLGDYVHLG